MRTVQVVKQAAEAESQGVHVRGKRQGKAIPSNRDDKTGTDWNSKSWKDRKKGAKPWTAKKKSTTIGEIVTGKPFRKKRKKGTPAPSWIVEQQERRDKYDREAAARLARVEAGVRELLSWANQLKKEKKKGKK